MKSQLTKIANLLNAVLQKPDYMCCGGISSGVVETLDKMLASQNWLHYLFTIHHL